MLMPGVKLQVMVIFKGINVSKADKIYRWQAFC